MGPTAVAVIRLRCTEPELPRPFHVLGISLDANRFWCCGFRDLHKCMAGSTDPVIGQVAIVFLGVPFFYRWRK